MLNKHVSSDGKIKNPEQAAKDIAYLAEVYSNNKKYMSPFARKAKLQGLRFQGGKPDDITVIVAQLDDELTFPYKIHHDLL